MKVLFLDCDGVTNSKAHFLATKDFKVHGADTLSDADLFAMKRDTNANNMFVLGYILDQVPDLKIVISSSWRLHYDLESFKDLFKIFNLDGSRIIGKTPKKFTSERVHEIHMWLDEVNEIKYDEDDKEIPTAKVKVDWVALDDHTIFNLEDPDKFREFLTDGWTGVTMHDAFKIIKHFNPNYKEPMIMI
jgi:HAD domain in Swiss Army Knife RNA repair proteins